MSENKVVGRGNEGKTDPLQNPVTANRLGQRRLRASSWMGVALGRRTMLSATV
jgi:hypothetical protein